MTDTEQARLDQLWLTPEPLRETWDHPIPAGERLGWIVAVVVTTGLGLLIGLVDRWRGRR